MHKYSEFWTSLTAKIGGKLPRIAFSDSSDPRVLKAARQIIDANIATPVLIGDKNKIDFDPQYVKTLAADQKERIAALLFERQQKSQKTMTDVHEQLNDTLYQAIAFLLDNQVDGLVAGSLRPTSDVVKAALQCIGADPKQRLISGHFLIETDHRVSYDNTPILFADCAVMPEPSVRALAAIAIGAAHSYQFFTGKTPRVALLSFSTRGSAVHPLVDRLKEAVELIRKQEPSLLVDGEIQADAALDIDVAKIKNAGDSSVAGKANVFVFPTLEAGNIGYKLVQRFSNARIAGPLLWGLNKPVSDLSRGCTPEEVADTARCVSTMAGRSR